jgi:hypothetical protein
MDCQRIAEDELVEKYLNGQLEPPLQDDLEVHILECSECLKLLEMMESVSADLSARANEVHLTAGKQTGSRAEVGLGRFTPRLATGVAVLVLVVLITVIAGVRSGLLSTHNQHAQDKPPVIKQTATNPREAFPEIAALAPAEQDAVLKVIDSRTISYPPSLADLEGQHTLRGESQKEKFLLLGPVGEIVSDSRPVFRWQPLTGATSYSVAVFDAKLNQVRNSPALTATQWRAKRPLPREQIYRWQVTAITSDGQSVISPSLPPEAKFLVLDQTKADELEQFRQAHPGAHLVLGIIYAQAGLLETAQGELEQVSAGANLELAQQLLRGLREKRNAAK